MKSILIENKIKEIIDQFFDEGELKENEALSYKDKLHIILSESIQALTLVTSIEDEFGIQFDDGDIDLAFFLSIEVITTKVKTYLKDKKNESVID